MSESDLCSQCKNVIPAGAKVCRECKLYQGRIRRELQYVAPMAAFIGVLASALVYISTQISYAYRAVTWKDKLEVIEFNSAGRWLFRNGGDGEVVVTKVRVESEDGGVARVWSVGEVMQPAATLKFQSPDAISYQNYHYLDRASYRSLPEKSKDVQFFDKDNLELNILRQKIVDLATFQCLGSVEFISSATGKHMSTSLEPCVGVGIEKRP
jgi:hypothetical protein